MGQELVDVGFARDFDVPVALFDIDAIKGIQNAFVAEVDAVVGTNGRNERLDCCDVDTSNSQVVDLAANEHAMAVERTLVQTALMCCGLETVTRNDRIDKLFPKGAGFWVALKCVLDGEYQFARDGDAMVVEVPIGILVVDDDKGRLGRRRGIRIGVRRVNFDTGKPLVGTQGKKQAHTRLFNAARVCVSQL